MPARDKFWISVLAAVLTGFLVLWPGTPIRSDLTSVVVVFAAVSLLVLWLFPESGVRE